MAIFLPLFPTHEHLVIPSFHCHTGKMLLPLVDRDQESTAYRKASSTEDHPAQNVDSLKGEVSKSTAIPLETGGALFSNLSSVRLFYHNSVGSEFNTLTLTELYCS